MPSKFFKRSKTIHETKTLDQTLKKRLKMFPKNHKKPENVQETSKISHKVYDKYIAKNILEYSNDLHYFHQTSEESESLHNRLHKQKNLASCHKISLAIKALQKHQTLFK